MKLLLWQAEDDRDQVDHEQGERDNEVLLFGEVNLIYQKPGCNIGRVNDRPGEKHPDVVKQYHEVDQENVGEHIALSFILPFPTFRFGLHDLKWYDHF